MYPNACNHEFPPVMSPGIQTSDVQIVPTYVMASLDVAIHCRQVSGILRS